jgi:hypothetical protein
MRAFSSQSHGPLTPHRHNGRMNLRALIAALPAVALVLGGAAPAASAALPKLDIRAKKKIRDDPKVPARVKAGGRTYRVEIELRGNSSQAFPKKPYAIETERKVRLLGMPRERDWILNAAYTDPTLLRDVLAHDAARRVGLASSRARHVELRINGRYRGVYVLMERAELSKRRVQGDALLELTERRKLDRGDESFPAAGGLAVRYVEPDEADKKKAQAARRAVEAADRAGARTSTRPRPSTTCCSPSSSATRRRSSRAPTCTSARTASWPSGRSGTSTSARAT